METKNIVSELVALLGPGVLLLPCKTGTKKPVGKWKHLTATAMEDPAYLAKLGRGNIGVVLGQTSGGLCSLDIDSDEGLQAFSDLNGAICQTLWTRGARGGNFWWKLQGAFPGLTPLKHEGQSWGEWRSDGAQTMIHGLHPSGKRYRFLRRAKPLTIAFADILWPENMTPLLSLNPNADDTERTEPTQRPQLTQLTQPTEDTQADRSGKGLSLFVAPVFTFEQALAAARSHAPGGNHERLFTLARGLKAVELHQGQPLTEAELKNIFGQWFDEAKLHLKKGLGFDDYWFEFMEGFDNVEHPLGAGVLDAAWAKSASASPPVVAEQFQDLNLRRVVSFCRELWRFRNQQPFFVSCRTLQRLLGHPDHVRAARWLRGLVRLKILGVVEIGNATNRKATRYRYLPKD